MNPVFWLLCLIDLCLKVWTSSLSQSHSYAPVNLSSMEQMQSDSTNTNGYNLLRGDVERERLTVTRGLSAPLLHVHLPIQMRAQKGEVCRVEVEEFQPLLSMVGHLEPKIFWKIRTVWFDNY
ncbi:Fras1 extracellular matrix protein [Fasciola gigantica]|uniref:Fras1 extracellular matrix protein n=1 Tax=Fasciola gigantica TaxID=46835 RepID=A0A504YWB4_FASGI|nr:Fras1 extracellular matrix protein [Fasciola gigantica]